MTGVDHHDHEKIVELTRVPTRFEAEVLVAALEARGIQASAVHSDAGGWAPNLSVFVGHRVMVFEGDLETARALLDEEGLTEIAGTGDDQ
jgi:Putative prokaryotic signal transducing protein